MNLTARQFRWLPNALTIARMLLAPVLVYAAATSRWTFGFWVLVLALGTDFLDGLAAKKLNAHTALGAQLDRRADAVISCGGLVGLAIAGIFPWWGVVAAPLIALSLAEERFFPFKSGLLRRYRPAISVSYLFLVWIFISWAFLIQAVGWHWWYVPLTASVLLLLASLKRHRIRAWLGMAVRG